MSVFSSLNARKTWHAILVSSADIYLTESPCILAVHPTETADVRIDFVQYKGVYMTTANTKTQAESFTGNLFLIGFMGSGKSTIAAELSRMLHRPVLEMDEEIEKREGMSIPAIFSEHGEAYFRQLETDLLKETSALGGFLVSCGGGAAMREENVREMKKSGIIVLLTALPETILERVADDENRPLLKGRKNTADIEALIEKRRPAYEAAANYQVATDQKTSAQIAGEILEILEKEGMIS